MTLKLKVISCDVFRREIYALAARSVNIVDVDFLPKGLHDLGSEPMRERVQAAIDATPSGYDAILLAYGLCNNGLSGVTARSVPLVLPRSHDCIGIFMGSRHKYLDYFYAHPGAYFETTGWIERGDTSADLIQISIPRQYGMDMEYEELVAKYGEDNARFIYDTLCDHTHNYRKITYIEMGLASGDKCEHEAMDKAAEKGWEFEKIPGDLGLLRRLLDGEWDASDFLVIPQGCKISPRYDDSVVQTEAAACTEALTDA
jgi:hypothetical protein